MQNLTHPSVGTYADFKRLNGGLPKLEQLKVTQIGSVDGVEAIAFTSEPGLTIPGLLHKGESSAIGVVVLSDEGKTKAMAWAKNAVGETNNILAIDPRGIGELKGIDFRLMTYLGTSIPFSMTNDVLAAVSVLKKTCRKVVVIGLGVACSQSVVFAGYESHDIDGVIGLNGLKSFAEALELPSGQYDVDGLVIQPRANVMPSLESLRSQLAKPTLWTIRNQPAPDIRKWVEENAK